MKWFQSTHVPDLVPSGLCLVRPLLRQWYESHLKATQDLCDQGREMGVLPQMTWPPIITWPKPDPSISGNSFQTVGNHFR